MADLFATKSLESIFAEARESGEHSLQRSLGPWILVGLGIGALLGTGIFVLTGPAAARYAGPAVVYAFMLAAVGCMFAGLCYAEFAAMIPVAGSAYTYGYATLGEVFAWIIGWDLILEYAFGAATVCSGWSGYVLSLAQDFGLRLPPELAGTPGSIFVLFQGHWEYLGRVAGKLTAAGVDPATLPQRHGVFNLVAFLGILAVTAILVVGVRESASLNSVIVLMKICVLVVFLTIGWQALLHQPRLRANWHPFIPSNTGSFGEFGWSGILRATGVIFFAYIGFDAVSTAAQEAKEPSRDMPIGIFGSLAICKVLYILIAITLTGLVNYRYLNVPDSLAVAMQVTGVRWGELLVKLGALGGLTSTMIVMLMGQSRIFFSMSRDGLLPSLFSRVHPTRHTPWVSSLTVGSVVAVFASTIPLDALGEMTNIGTLLAFVIVCAGIWILRHRRPEIHRPFRAPLMPLTPILGILISLAIMLGLPRATWLRLFIWLGAGLLIYFGYGRNRSRVQRALAQQEALQE